MFSDEKNLEITFNGITWIPWVTRNMSFWHLYPFSVTEGAHLKEFGVNGTIEMLFVTRNGTYSRLYVSKRSFDKYKAALLEAVATKEKLTALKGHYKTHAQKVIATARVSARHPDAAHWIPFTDALAHFYPALRISTSLSKIGTQRLIHALQNDRVPEKEIPALVGTLSYPSTHTPLFCSQRDVLRIAAMTPDTSAYKNALRVWLTHYQHIPVNFCDDPWTITDLKTQVSTARKKDPAQELKQLEQNHRKRITQTRALLQGVNDEVAHWARVLQVVTYLNEFRKSVYSQASLLVRPVFIAAAKQAHLQSWKDCFFLSSEEIAQILRGKQINAKKIIRSRAYAGAYCVKDKAHLLTPAQAQALFEKMEQPHPTTGKFKETMVHGFSANKGLVRARARILRSSKDFGKLASGEIIIAPMTSVDYAPVMHRAAAFVTDEGGITSHAGIVAREMNKPCVVGTKIATKVFHDGDVVEVNGNTGIVRIIL